MNEASEPTRVVNLSQRMDSSSERVGELLGAVRGIAHKRLQQWVGNAFEQVDDALFDLAEKGENNAAQIHYFDGMREVRKRRPGIERNFLNTIARKLIYRIEDGIPVMLPEEGIGTQQLAEFPAA